MLLDLYGRLGRLDKQKEILEEVMPCVSIRWRVVSSQMYQRCKFVLHL